jgi:glycine cleavage system aminomethyltransferase T
MVGLLLPADAPITELRGATIAAGGSGHSRGGFVGTTVWSPALERPIALAFVPRDIAGPGTEVMIRPGEGEIVATITDLPFVDQESQQVNRTTMSRIGE